MDRTHEVSHGLSYYEQVQKGSNDPGEEPVYAVTPTAKYQKTHRMKATFFGTVAAGGGACAWRGGNSSTRLACGVIASLASYSAYHSGREGWASDFLDLHDLNTRQVVRRQFTLGSLTYSEQVDFLTSRRIVLPDGRPVALASDAICRFRLYEGPSRSPDHKRLADLARRWTEATERYQWHRSLLHADQSDLSQRLDNEYDKLRTWTDEKGAALLKGGLW